MSQEVRAARERAVFGDDDAGPVVLAPTNVADGTLSAAYITMSLFMLAVCITGFATCAAWAADALGVTKGVAPSAGSKFAAAVSWLGLAMGVMAGCFLAKDATIAARQVGHWARHGVPGTGRAAGETRAAPAEAGVSVERGWGMWVGEVTVIGLVAPALWYGPALVRAAMS